MGNSGPLVLKESPAPELPGHTAPTEEEDFKDTKPHLFFSQIGANGLRDYMT